MTIKEDSSKHGAFSWMELMTTDVESAKGFYLKLFSWDTEDASMDPVEPPTAWPNIPSSF
ncbi:MAG: hypothetical protein JSW38_01900 [Dehalococcoidia bacterium]|nr:MAG: hypothetical protein JSV02_10370 [Dehalococcoidia bacterium]UCG84726.1 MAG: hypothetical protein JSW38_01900 [Dehalococcoidia bacterium]